MLQRIHGETFNEFLIRNFKESQKIADKMPEVKVDDIPADFIRDLYYRMIKYGENVDIEGLKKEAMKMLKISKEQLESELNEFKSEEKND